MISLHGTSSRVTSRKSTATRQRVSRACDRCNQLRTKCDGQSPCEHCVGEELIISNQLKLSLRLTINLLSVFGLDCEYKREQKKRGKASNAFLSRQKRPTASNSLAMDGSQTPIRNPPSMINTSASSSNSSADSSAASSPSSLPRSPLFSIESQDEKLDPRLQFVRNSHRQNAFF